MSQQFFEVSKGILIDETVAIITGTGEAGSGINDGAAIEASVGTLYLRSQQGSVKFYQKILDGAGTDKWEGLASAADISDIDNIRASLGTIAGDLTLGIMSGGIISDNSTVKSALEQLTAYAEQTRSIASKLEFFNSVIDIVDDSSVPVSPSTGDRYLVSTTGNGFNANSVYEYNGTQWVEQVPTTGTMLSVDDEPSVVYQFNGSSWDAKAFENTLAGAALDKVGSTLNLVYNTDQFNIGSGNALTVKTAGIGFSELNLGLSGNSFNASHLPLLASTNTLVSASNVDSAIVSLYNGIQSANLGLDGVIADIVDLQDQVTLILDDVAYLDGRVSALETNFQQNNQFGNLGGQFSTVATVLTDSIVAITWHVIIEDEVTKDREFIQVSAMHNAPSDGSADATEVVFNVYGKLRQDNVAGDGVDVVLSGTGVNQQMRLRIKANNSFTTRVLKAEVVKM